MKKLKISGLIAALVVVLAFGAYGIYTHNNFIPQYKWSVKLFDADTGNEIKEAEIAIAELDKTFEISEKNNIISHPIIKQKSPSKTGTYPYGYTIITYSKGYFPRIDHNISYGGDGELTLELTKVRPFTNQTYTEYFHGAAVGSTGEFIYHYFGNAPFEQ